MSVNNKIFLKRATLFPFHFPLLDRDTSESNQLVIASNKACNVLEYYLAVKALPKK